jgi:hypothetical protein
MKFNVNGLCKMVPVKEIFMLYLVWAMYLRVHMTNVAPINHMASYFFVCGIFKYRSYCRGYYRWIIC